MSYIKNADIQGNAWVAPAACVVGNVTLGDESSVWYNAVIRGDMAPIVVGCGSNVQDGTVVHADAGFPCEIGNGTSIGHNAIIHGCTIGHIIQVIGMGATVMNGAKIGSDCNHRGRKSCRHRGTVIP
ncbi:MAG: gamma carbonic anhydrase family protein [Anaerobutyricum sp.]